MADDRSDRFTLSSAKGLKIVRNADRVAQFDAKETAIAVSIRTVSQSRMTGTYGRAVSATRPAGSGSQERKWHLIDADGLAVGRAAAVIAKVLRGKHRTNYTPYSDFGDHVVVINADKIRFTSNKLSHKTYYRHASAVGGIKQLWTGKAHEGRFPERVLEKAVERMIPRGPLGRQQMRNLRIYKGAEHPFEAEYPEPFEFSGSQRKPRR